MGAGIANVEPALTNAVARVAAVPQLLVATDFDGTLAPLVDDPARAKALPEAEAALIRLGSLAHTDVAVISGRSLASLRAGIGRLNDHAIAVGGHGIERDDDGPTPEEMVQLDAVARAFDDVIIDVPGAWVERKPFSVVLHLRMVPVEHLPGVAETAQLVGAAHAPHVMTGHGVVEVLIRPAAKGAALQNLRIGTSADAVVYFGDDITDDDAFATLGPDDLGISIGPTPTNAEFRITSPHAAASVLELLADERALHIN